MPHACMVRALLTEPSPQPFLLSLPYTAPQSGSSQLCKGQIGCLRGKGKERPVSPLCVFLPPCPVSDRSPDAAGQSPLLSKAPSPSIAWLSACLQGWCQGGLGDAFSCLTIGGTYRPPRDLPRHSVPCEASVKEHTGPGSRAALCALRT